MKTSQLDDGFGIHWETNDPNEEIAVTIFDELSTSQYPGITYFVPETRMYKAAELMELARNEYQREVKG